MGKAGNYIWEFTTKEEPGIYGTGNAGNGVSHWDIEELVEIWDGVIKKGF